MQTLQREVFQRLERLDVPFNVEGVDPFGVSRAHLAKAMTWLGWMYRNYFKVSVVGAEHVPPSGPAMLVGNHAGGYAVDALTVYCACFFELEPPRLAHTMADKFLGRLPFAAEWAAKLGHLTGLPQHGLRLLRDGRLLVVFPEGVRGTAKLYSERHSLVQFGSGFMRLALEARVPIVPFAFLGAGEAVPTFANLRGLGQLLGLPYLPVTPYLLNIPLPVALQIRFGVPVQPRGEADAPDAEIHEKVEDVRGRIAALMEEGLMEVVP